MGAQERTFILQRVTGGAQFLQAGEAPSLGSTDTLGAFRSVKEAKAEAERHARAPLDWDEDASGTRLVSPLGDGVYEISLAP